MGVQRVSVLRVSLAVLKTLVVFLQGYLQVISAGLKKGEKRLQFKCPFNQEVWRGKEGKKENDFFSNTEDITCEKAFLSSEQMLTHHLPQQTEDSFWSHCLLHGNHNFSFS